MVGQEHDVLDTAASGTEFQVLDAIIAESGEDPRRFDSKSLA